MKKALILLCMALLSLPVHAAETPQLKLISFNLRNSGGEDGSNRWEHRRHATERMIREEAPDLFGVQEALADQLQYLDESCPQYARVGVGRDDGDKAGETMAIYYRHDRFELVNSGTLWLSETPETPSRGWDGACNRTVTWVELRDKTSGKSFFYFNTHLDHQGRQAREEGIKLLVEIVGKVAGKAPAILGGDFNSPTDSPIFRPLVRFMKSARDKAPESDNEGTFNGFGTAPDTIVIDHIYFRGKLRCLQFKTLKGDYGAPYISDHYPIEMVFTL
ncbi:MAG TPA: endonuclease/exonuclease/phosphatase family protein [Candidatus Alistipes faecigallinarum]|nr:endonuclease/exonuclease/phosphatase family protein [Candidatus Alistipes faecigallinarum]